MENGFTALEFKTILEMVIMIIEDARDKDEAIEKLRGLSIFRDSRNDEDNDQ